jgi:hypothetical protein
MMRFRRGLAAAAAVVVLVACGAGEALANRFFVDPPTSTPSDTLFTVDLRRDAGDVVQGFDARLVYDPSVVRLTGITAGDWLTAPLAPFALYNTSVAGEDTIRFSAALLGHEAGSADAGVVAVLHFAALRVGVSPLEIVRLVARDAANAEVPFTHSTGDRIIIDQAVPADPVTLGRVKALYLGR